MDRYKFRGKVTMHEDFIYGSLVVIDKEQASIIPSGSVSMIGIISTTVGQYTGKQDENKTDVYEHDIVMNFNYGHYYLVVWDEESVGFYLKPITNNDDWLNFEEFEELSSLGYIVAGNVTDNPELLEG